MRQSWVIIVLLIIVLVQTLISVRVNARDIINQLNQRLLRYSLQLDVLPVNMGGV